MRAIDLSLKITLALVIGAFSMEKPVAEIGYQGIYKSGGQYRVKFNSNINLDLLRSEINKEKVVSRRLVCSLLDDADLSVKHNLTKFFRGNFSASALNSNSEIIPFKYESVGNFYFSQDRGTSKRVIDDIVLIRILEMRTTIPCRVVMTIYLRKPYYSTTMHIPAADIVAEVNR